VFNKYYQDELQFLRELGEEFARANPAVAHHLSGPGHDPDVERLLEGFAFLSARVRQKLDDEFPELTHALMHLLWPHYLRPVPSMAILEFNPVLQALRQSQRVVRGTEVQSVAVEGTSCRFQTAYDVMLHPLSMESVALEARSSGPSSLKLRLKIWNQAKPGQLRLDPLRVHLRGDPTTTYALFHHLHRHVEEIRVAGREADLERGPYRTLELKPVGFAEQEAVIPYPTASLPAYRHLQEYFSLPEKFLFVDFTGLGALAELAVDDRFEIEVRFDRALAPGLRPTREDVRLFCTPIVNLFAHEADPIRVNPYQAEYRLRPEGRDPFHYEIFSVDRVTAYTSGAAEERILPPFYGFSEAVLEGRENLYHAQLRPSVVDDRVDTYVTFVDRVGAQNPPEAETVGFHVTCTNRRLAEALRPGDVNVPTDSSPAFVNFTNLTAPTPSIAPPLDGDLQWRLISHLALNYLPLTNVEALRGVLQLYNLAVLRDPRAARAHALRLEGIQGVRGQAVERLERGHLMRGTAVTIDMLEDRFAGDGDLFLFASVLNEFIALNATLNSFTELRVRGVQRGEETVWPCRTGRDPL
jgi:type VI secretion system protein ImpG